MNSNFCNLKNPLLSYLHVVIVIESIFFVVVVIVIVVAGYFYFAVKLISEISDRAMMMKIMMTVIFSIIIKII